MKPCQHEGCTKTSAIEVLVIKIPALGHALETHDPLEIKLGLAMCAEHYREVNPAEILTEDIKSAIETAVTWLGKAPPDFARAFLGPLPS